ncbi:MAG: Jag N-terminal domain-containing protein [Sulfurimonas sp.]|uniref:Jag N-terminal domain-containing protein n=1 Tax=Sulfurimonas sp. TaxID=2022749 RepID=UPI0026004843|nr:Jag N-terminal domain-containing protein [Sulfurimonas sp.]MCK9453941.1 Jag N-terminal domain-containing protein [Sulfurimonas sp.]
MIKIESTTLEQACKDAAAALECSASELVVEIVQSPSSGFLGLFKKSAIIVAAKKKQETKSSAEKPIKKDKQEFKSQNKQTEKKEFKKEEPKPSQNIINDTIIPQSFVSMQDEDDYDLADINYTADYEEDEVEKQEEKRGLSAYEVVKKVEKEINELFNSICFKIEKIEVSAYDEDTLLVEFKGEDAALLIGKEGYRYKALSYMIFNWINTKYQLQLRLEIAEFLKNQEESVGRYLVGVCENIDRDGRAQTKILDGVLIQIALKELREKYPNKYVAVRSTRDGLKFIIINDYHN